MPTQTPEPPPSPCAAVDVFAPARLHLGFLDVSGTLGRQFGSLGLTIDGIGTRIRLSRASAQSEPAPVSERASRLLASLLECNVEMGPLQLTLSDLIPEHVGLGSGTQLGLALAAGVAALAGERVSGRSLAQFVERGARSGIVIGAFETCDEPAPIIARMDFPEAWRLILIFDHARRGLFGDAEKEAFRALPGFPADAAARLCHLAMLRLLPGLAQVEFGPVAGAIGEISARVGDHFAPVQGGRFASPRVALVLGWLQEAGFTGIGQSSWGPTGFALMPSEAEAAQTRDALDDRFGGDAQLSFMICAGRNRGAEIRRFPGLIEGRAFARPGERRDARGTRR